MRRAARDAGGASRDDARSGSRHEAGVCESMRPAACLLYSALASTSLSRLAWWRVFTATLLPLSLSLFSRRETACPDKVTRELLQLIKTPSRRKRERERESPRASSSQLLLPSS